MPDPLMIRGVIYQGEETDLLVAHGRIFAGSSTDAAQTIDGTGLLAIPGLVDVHVHFRDPGFTEKEDLHSGARAAAAGGYCAVLCEPNTRPVMDTPALVINFQQRACELPLGVYTKAAVTVGEAGLELTEIDALAKAGVSGLSDDGEPLLDSDLLVRAFRASARYDAFCLTAHCEETPHSAEHLRAALGDGPAMAREAEIIRLHLAALERAGTGRLHIQHVSLAKSVNLLVEAKQRGLAVTAEVSPHHLLLCAEDIPLSGGMADANWKMNPPLRARSDMLAVRRALAEGTIDMIATDHAPHTAAEKAREWDAAPFGVIGLETALGAALTLVRQDVLSLGRLVEAMSVAPRRLLPSWTPVGDDNLTLIDPHAAWTVDPDQFYSKGRNCPFAGWIFTGRARYTIARGSLVMADGQVIFS
ncbi:MAG: dihydroorotase [Armatimonadota bacterium]